MNDHFPVVEPYTEEARRLALQLDVDLNILDHLVDNLGDQGAPDGRSVEMVVRAMEVLVESNRRLQLALDPGSRVHVDPAA